ncbi:methyltransferase [Granulicatella sp. zg-ZJ]|uniref:class I SAM-dependent methyltransferase n=1 Tax=Granulicatella sp. zg-ZJ TaxID=2678504 RepID=UPI0013D409CB|nr:class I SAM-dependent methyltransferase [Granulicatella sp. zg-ZJ]NEW62723.1 methyltransferase [Granulicatella sp. zg-ZJ]
MSEYYYSHTPTSKTDEQKHTIVVANQTLSIWTDHGVFSKTGLDFGSRTLLETIKQDMILPKNPAILDVGCGYGPIGLTLAKAYSDAFVTMVDINERAVHLTEKNIHENKVNHAKVLQSNVYEAITEQFDMIVSNPPIRAGKKVVHHILEESISYLKPNGYIVIVIQKKQGAPSAQKKMEDVFGNVTLLNRDKGYWILCSQLKG